MSEVGTPPPHNSGKTHGLVASNKKKRKIEGENTAVDLLTRIGWPSSTKFKSIINSGQLKNNKVTVEDIARVEYIIGKLVRLSKSKIIWRKTLVYPQIHWVSLSAPNLQFHKDVTFNWYFFFINSIPFLTSQVRKIMHCKTQIHSCRQ